MGAGPLLDSFRSIKRIAEGGFGEHTMQLWGLDNSDDVLSLKFRRRR